MINKLIEEIKKEAGKYHLSSIYIDEQIISLLILKYLCENGQYSYKEALQNEEINLLKYTMDNKEYKLRYVKSKLVANIQFDNLTDLVKDFLSTNNESVNIFNHFQNKLCIPTSLNKNIYDITGNTTYVIDKFDIYHFDIQAFKFFDLVFGIENKYVSLSDIELRDYDYIYIYDNRPRYYYGKTHNKDIYDLIHSTIYKGRNVILHTEFKKISNLRSLSYRRRYLEKIILFEDETAILLFNCINNEEISIINYDKSKIKSIKKLIEIINTNKKQKDVLIKIKQKDIEDNQYRIGFRLYQHPRVEDKLNINQIVDENTELIDRLSKINEIIEQEINKLINR